ncbi:MAG: AI-2E family transporter [Clostridia bacterium]|nr:AI-2E family transporter [Clostridia bacterium]
MDKKLFRSIVIILLIAALLALTVIKFDAIFSVIKLLISILSPVIAGVLIAIFLDRPFSLFKRLFLRCFKKAKHKHALSTGFSVAMTYVLLLTFVAVFLVAVIPEVTASVTSLLANIGRYVENVENALNGVIANYEFLKENIEPFDFTEWEKGITALISTVAETVQTRLPEIFNITKSIAGGLTNAILGIIISIYIMAGRNHLKWQARKTIYAFFPKNVADKIREIAKLTARTLTGYISGRVIDSIIVGILCFIFMKIFGFEYASLISFIIGVTNIIPMLGPFIGAIPSAFLLLLVNPGQCFWFIIFVIILQQVDSNLIDPRISGEATGLPAIWVLISITLGGGLFGILGFILSVPLCAVLYTLTRKEVARRTELKGLPLNDESDRDPPVKKWTFSEIKEKIAAKIKTPPKEKS